MADEPAGLPLADFIGALRAELRAAALAKDPQLQFNVGPVNVEFTPTTRHEGGGKAGIRFWVVEAGASASVANESTQKVTLALTPVTASGEPWQVADEVEERPPYGEFWPVVRFSRVREESEGLRMGFDRHRVMEVFVKPVNGPGRVGSGYRVNQTAVLTAGHVVTGLPVCSPAQLTAGDAGAGRCELRALGERAWMSGSVLWRDESADVALIGLAGDVPPLPGGSPVPRWGRVNGMEPIAVTAAGFPWAQERPDRVRDSEQLFGFIAPATTEKAGLCAVTVQTSPPAGRAELRDAGILSAEEFDAQKARLLGSSG